MVPKSEKPFRLVTWVAGCRTLLGTAEAALMSLVETHSHLFVQDSNNSKESVKSTVEAKACRIVPVDSTRERAWHD